MFKALGVETRLKIFEIIKAEGPLGVKRIAEIVGITPAAVSQHVKILRQAGLVKSERNGYYIPYSVDEEAVDDCCGTMLRVCSCHLHHHHGKNGCRNGDVQLETLREYERQIERELERVREKIKKVNKEK
jgi:ArsR family transcriptional regulator